MPFKEEFERIFVAEAKLQPDKIWIIPDAEEMHNILIQIVEFAKANKLLRSFNSYYGLTTDSVSYESDGAHTNLMSAILDRALSFKYGSNFRRSEDGYTYREIMEVARRHDLPENIFGDIPDNGDRDEEEKTFNEQVYHSIFRKLSPKRERDFERKVCKLLDEMEQKSTRTGRLLYMADKISAVIIVLLQDSVGEPALLSPKSPLASPKDLEEMKMCDNKYQGSYKASEMWTIDYFIMRNLAEYDDTGFFTALLILYTLEVNKKWYKWREKYYL